MWGCAFKIRSGDCIQCCLEDCSSGNLKLTYYSNGDCISECPDDSYGYQSEGECLSLCPDGLYGYSGNHTCINQQQCNDIGWFVYNQDCIEDCSVTTDPQLKYSYEGNCIVYCPEGFYVYNDESPCLSVCPTNYYSYDTD